jgi:hypothetical protein
MTTSTVLRPSVRAALHALIDYAGLFPPAQLSVSAAQAEYAAARAGPHAWMLGRFIVPASALAEWSGDAQLSVVLDGGLEQLDEVAAMRERAGGIAALEVPPRLWAQGETFADAIDALSRRLEASRAAGLTAFVEIPSAAHSPQSLAQTMSAVARAGLGAKLRCGGLTSEAFPTVDAVADFVLAANNASVPFKATAGLHHPVRRHDDDAGFAMHGSLNLLAAAALAGRVDSNTLRRIVAEEDPGAFRFDDEAFAWRNERIGIEELTQARRAAFVAYGSCSFSEPIGDLSALGMLPAR